MRLTNGGSIQPGRSRTHRNGRAIYRVTIDVVELGEIYARAEMTPAQARQFIASIERQLAAIKRGWI